MLRSVVLSPKSRKLPVSDESTNNFEEQIQNTTETPPVESISEEDPDDYYQQ